MARPGFTTGTPRSDRGTYCDDVTLGTFCCVMMVVSRINHPHHDHTNTLRIEVTLVDDGCEANYT
jgi:hypothetical protein